MKIQVVLDGSITAAWFLPDESSQKSEMLLEKILKEELFLVQPTLWYYEMVNLLRTAVLRQRLNEPAAKKGLYFLQRIPVELVSPSQEGLSDILSASLRHPLSAYDASYFRLAEERGIDLISGDADLLSLAPQYPWIKTLHDIRY